MGPRVETFTVRGANGSMVFDTEITISLPHACVADLQKQEEAACKDWGGNVDVIDSYFERDGRWKPSVPGTCRGIP